MDTQRPPTIPRAQAASLYKHGMHIFLVGLGCCSRVLVSGKVLLPGLQVAVFLQYPPRGKGEELAGSSL